MQKILIAVLALLISDRLYSQFNDSTFYLLRYASTGTINRTTDASSYVLNNAVRFSMSKKAIVLNSNTNWIFGEQQKKLVNNDFVTTTDFNWYRTWPHFYYWGLGTFESSYSLKVNNRTQFGIGAAYNLVERKNVTINVSDGILYEFSDLQISDSSRDTYSTFRNSFRFRFRFVYNDKLVFDGVSFIQNSLQYKNDYILNSTTHLSYKLTKWISFTTSLTYNRLNRTNRENMLLTFGLTAEKYF